MSDSDGYDFGDISWSEVARGRRGTTRPARNQQERLRNMPGALGMLAGGQERRAQQQQQQHRYGRDQERYPKAVTRRAGF